MAHSIRSLSHLNVFMTLKNKLAYRSCELFRNQRALDISVISQLLCEFILIYLISQMVTLYFAQDYESISGTDPGFPAGEGVHHLDGHFYLQNFL